MFNDYETSLVWELIRKKACAGGQAWFYQWAYTYDTEELIRKAPDGYINWLINMMPALLAPNAQEHVDLLLDALYTAFPHIAWTTEGGWNTFHLMYEVKGETHNSSQFNRLIERGERAAIIRIIMDWVLAVKDGR